ncbi:Alpha/beta hydrolase family protein [Acinetobacter stercoris]|uniref:Alpha/beta hydrolase family protein n=2 Tax=Acinetobacter stercoris TaxID=2126983 RepID=A0A2U3MZE5_9GAMM|nr:Alpha/beta hydrolase family protein [Acinetobacter stercoris]
MMNKTLMAVVLLSSSLILVACNDNDDNPQQGNSTDINNIQNPVVGTPTAYSLTDFSSVAGESVVMTYKMLGVNNQIVQATALVFTPKTTQPINGWPIVVWAHGTTGVADQCAPSRNKITDSTFELITKLLNAGYVVVAPDYEGLGDPEGKAHPFLNVKSEAYSITDAVVATRNWLGNKVSKQWLTVGHSQGGQAALGAAQYASRANLDYKGTVAVAPASNLKTIFNFGDGMVQNLPAGQQVPTYASLNTFAALIVAGMKDQRNPATYNQVFQSKAEVIATQADTICSGELAKNFGEKMGEAAFTVNTLDGYLTQTSFMQVPSISTFLEQTSQPLTAKVSTPIKIYQGEIDATVPYIATNVLVSSAEKLGTKINLVTGKTWDHGTVMSQNVDNIVADIKSYMATQ